MKSSTFALLGTLASVSLGAGVVMAKEMDHPRMGMVLDAERFAEIDADSNGEITHDEMKAHREARFAASDSDGDGMLSAAEIAAQMRDGADRRAERMVARMDKDGDGMLAPDEMGRRGHGGDRGDRMTRMFERADADNSGGLSMAEMEQMRERIGKRMHKRFHSDED